MHIVNTFGSVKHFKSSNRIISNASPSLLSSQYLIMNVINTFVRGSIAFIFTLTQTLVFTPFWLVSSVLRKRISKESPNWMQVYLCHVTRSFLYWLAFFSVQPARNTRTPSLWRDKFLHRMFQWVQPARTSGTKKSEDEIEMDIEGANGENVFDSAKLPLDVEDKEKDCHIAGLWFLNPKERKSKESMKRFEKRQSHVVLWFRKCIPGIILVSLSISQTEEHTLH